MKKINEYIKKVLNEKVVVYEFDKEILFDDASDILDIFEANGVTVKRASISGVDYDDRYYYDDYRSLFQTFDNANSIRYFSPGDSSIEKVSFLCEINKINFRLICDYYKQLVGVVSKVQDNPDLEPILLQIEKLGKEKTKYKMKIQ